MPSTSKPPSLPAPTTAQNSAPPSPSTYVVLQGIARVSQDRAKIDELWDKTYEVWFPNGKDDPDVAHVISFVGGGGGGTGAAFTVTSGKITISSSGVATVTGTWSSPINVADSGTWSAARP